MRKRGRCETAFAIAQEHEVLERPVTTLYQNDVQMTVGIDVANADVGGSRSGVLQGELSIEAPRAAFRRIGPSASEEQVGRRRWF